MKICICFYGITRSLSYTIDSIRQNVIEPHSDMHQVIMLAHYYNLNKISNERSGESGIVNKDEINLLRYDHLDIEQPENECLLRKFEYAKKFGDSWNDNYKSLKNLMHQLQSLQRVTSKALEYDPDIVIFVRPDLKYHDKVSFDLDLLSNNIEPAMVLPAWQHHLGYNDRFAICNTRAAMLYGGRLGFLQDYFESGLGPLNGERLVRFTAEKNQIKTRSLY